MKRRGLYKEAAKQDGDIEQGIWRSFSQLYMLSPITAYPSPDASAPSTLPRRAGDYGSYRRA